MLEERIDLKQRETGNIIPSNKCVYVSHLKWERYDGVDTAVTASASASVKKKREQQ